MKAIHQARFFWSLIVWLLMMNPSVSRADVPGYVCGGQCVGIDFNEKLVYQVGEVGPSIAPTKNESYRNLKAKCTRALRALGAEVPALLVKKIDYEGAFESVGTYSFQARFLRIADASVYRSASAESAESSASQSAEQTSSGWYYESRKMRVRMEYLYEGEACHFDRNAGIPEYEGSEDAQG